MILASCYDALISRSGDFCGDRQTDKQTNRWTKLIALPLAHTHRVIVGMDLEVRHALPHRAASTSGQFMLVEELNIMLIYTRLTESYLWQTIYINVD